MPSTDTLLNKLSSDSGISDDDIIFNDLEELSRSDLRDLRFPTHNDSTLLHIAGNQGRSKIIDYLVNRGVPVDSVDRDGWTSLHRAAFINQLDIVETLLRNGANPSKKNNHSRTPAHIAAEWENIDSIAQMVARAGREILSVCDGNGKTVYDYSTEESIRELEDLIKEIIKETTGDVEDVDNQPSVNNQEDIRNKIVDNYPDETPSGIDLLTAFSSAMQSNAINNDSDDNDFAHVLKRDRDSLVEILKLFNRAVQSGRLNIVSEMVKILYAGREKELCPYLSCGHDFVKNPPSSDKSEGDKPNNKLYRRLSTTACLEFTTNTDRKNYTPEKFHINMRDNDGWTPLLHATFLGQIEICEYLLSVGANILSQTVYGRNPLHLAAEWDNDEVVKLLLQTAADYDKQNESRGNYTDIPPICKLLVEARDNTGGTPSSHAASYSIKQMLLRVADKFNTTNSKDDSKPTSPTSSKMRKLSANDQKTTTDILNENLSGWGSQFEVDPSSLDCEELAGTGLTASVYRGTWRGSEVAIKKIKFSPTSVSKIQKAFIDELLIMTKCRHPNLVLLMGAKTTSFPLIIVTEYCYGGSLFDLLHGVRAPDGKGGTAFKKNWSVKANSENYSDEEFKVQLSPSQKIKIAMDIAKGVNYLHSSEPKIIHRDLKSLNVLIAEEVIDTMDVPIAKVADFGLCKIKDDISENMTASAGTFHWMAPECIDGLNYDEKVDTYSFGVCLYEIIYRKIPYGHRQLQPVSIAMAVSRGERPAFLKMSDGGQSPDLTVAKDRSNRSVDFRNSDNIKAIVSDESGLLPHDCPREMFDLMLDCWKHAPEDRPAFNEILQIFRKMSAGRSKKS